MSRHGVCFKDATKNKIIGLALSNTTEAVTKYAAASGEMDIVEDHVAHGNTSARNRRRQSAEWKILRATELKMGLPSSPVNSTLAGTQSSKVITWTWLQLLLSRDRSIQLFGGSQVNLNLVRKVLRKESFVQLHVLLDYVSLGHYIPPLAARLHATRSKIKLRGVVIGNGFVSPAIQFTYLPQMAFNSATAPTVITEEEYYEMLDKVPSCVSSITACNKGWQPHVCRRARDMCLHDLVEPISDKGIDIFDLRRAPRECPKPPASCRSYQKFQEYFNNPTVQSNLGIKQVQWNFSNHGVYESFAADYVWDYSASLPPLMDAGLRVGFFLDTHFTFDKGNSR
ncbi:hypothetical protein FOL47_008046 [Perkinsus chesapeaki]|uniref:Uncharacterized protein n=1 Tax=Perkinsus chesapeaki TaxID=330153 RepID=A0A7J6N230_PERCH|nr:hypothetical protein FOL47_008046 [Perkinsus chesapeaki]